MLSVQGLSSAVAAARYYAETYNYYRESNDESALQWFGKTAKLLGLSGVVEKEQFTKLLAGDLPNGQQLGRIREGKRQHRPGFDLTFNAPKSVSILALLPDGDQHLIAAHDLAVKKTLALFEHEFAQTRVVRGGEIHYENTQNLAIASFRQYTSRANDMHLHTHNVVLNVTQGRDGRYRALASDMARTQGTYENAWNYRNYFGAVYRAFYAKQITELGYCVRVTDVDGRFEIEGVPDVVIKKFSKRRGHIENWLHEKGLSGAKAAQAATLATRQGKENIALPQLQQRWQQEAEGLNFCLPLTAATLASTLPEAAPKNLVPPRIYKTWARLQAWMYPDVPIAQQALQFAIGHLGEREALVKDSALRTLILGFAPGKILPADVAPLLQNAIAAQKIIQLHTERGQTLWTTPQALAMELEGLRIIEHGVGRVAPVASTIQMNALLKEHTKNSPHALTADQRNAVKLLLSTRDRVVGVQGFAGTGKTTLLRLVKQQAETNGFSVKGTAPTGVAARKLEQETGMPTQTVSRILLELERPPTNNTLPAKTLLVLDEASMVGNANWHRLLKAIEKHDQRLWVVGDTLQLNAIEHGRPFSLAQLYGMQTTTLKTIVRQAEHDVLGQQTKRAVEAAIDRDINRALAQVTHLIEAPSKDERLAAILYAYLSRPQNERAKTLLIVPTHRDRERVHIAIRQELQAQGVLQGEAITLTALKPKSLTQAQLRHARFYKPGDVLRFGRAYRTLGVMKDSYATVIASCTEKNRLHLQITANKKVTWHFKKLPPQADKLEVYAPRPLTLQVGDQLRIKRNDKNLNVVNGESVHVTALNTQSITLTRQNSEELVLPRNSPALQHVDYAYTHTDFSVQGLDNDRVVMLLESNSPLTQQKSFYIGLSRAKHSVTLITDDKERLEARLRCASGDKTSALDAMRFAEIQQRWPLKQKGPALWALAHKAKIELNTLAFKKRLQDYQTEVKLGRSVHCDRLAHTLWHAKKNHASVLEKTTIKLTVLRQQAHAHQRRTMLAKAPNPQRQALYRAEAYVCLNRTIARRFARQTLEARQAARQHKSYQKKAKWRSLRQTAPTPQLAQQIQAQFTKDSTTRNQLAWEIMQDVEKHQDALIQLGVLDRPDSRVEKNKATQAKKTTHQVGWQKLQMHADRHQAIETVKQWQGTKNPDEKQMLAHAIVNDPRLHHAAIVSLGPLPKTTWQAVRCDAKIYQTKAAFALLDANAKQQQRMLQRYQKAHQKQGRAWAAYFTLKAQAKLSLQQKTVLSKRLQAAKMLSAKRDYLAHTMLQYTKLETDGGLGIGLDIAKLHTQAQEHQTKIDALKQLNTQYQSMRASLAVLPTKAALDKIINYWADWQAVQEEKGRALQQVMQNLKLYRYAGRALNIDINQFAKALCRSEKLQQHVSTLVKHAISANEATLPISFDDQERKRLQRTQTIWQGSVPIQGTLAERYLKQHRGIQGGLPSSLRYHWGLKFQGKLRPALVMRGENQAGALRAVQVIYLDKKTANKANVDNPKMTYGVPSKDSFGVLINPGKNNKTIVIAEGAETALSLKEVLPDTTIYASCGTSNFKRVPLHKEIHTVLIAADNDGRNAASLKVLHNAAQQLTQRQIDVHIAMPEMLPGLKKTDYNDVLLQQGASAIQKSIQQAKLLQPALTTEYLIQQLEQTKQCILKQDFGHQTQTTLEAKIVTDKSLAAKLQEDPQQLQQVMQALQQDDRRALQTTVKSIKQAVLEKNGPVSLEQDQGLQPEKTQREIME